MSSMDIHGSYIETKDNQNASKCIVHKSLFMFIMCIPLSQEPVCKRERDDEHVPLVKSSQGEPAIQVKKEPQLHPTPGLLPDPVVTKIERIATPQRRRQGLDDTRGRVSQGVS